MVMRIWLILLISSTLVIAGCGQKKTKTAETGSKAQSVDQTIPDTPKPVTQASQQTPHKVDGAKFYKRCSACHGQDGDGIPGSFPALNAGLDALATTQKGRAYLVAVVYNGLRGQLIRPDATYNGVMVRQAAGKSPADVAAVLNHILKTFYPNTKLQAFTPEEVEQIHTSQGRLKPTEVLVLRPSEG